MIDTSIRPGHSVHRIEALTDGIYAVAMTLLVIDLKVPDHSLIHTTGDLVGAVVQLSPRFLAWMISFLVLAFIWFAHHRTFSHVGQATGRLMALNFGQLAFVSLMPFSSALIGEYGGSLFSQIAYSADMVVVAVFALLLSRYVYRHPQLAPAPMPLGAYRATQIRGVGLIAISTLAVAISSVVPALGNIAFMLMAVIMPVSRRIEARINARPRAPKT